MNLKGLCHGMKKMTFSKIKLLFAAVLAFLYLSPLSSQNFYWEYPQTILSGDNRFPRTVNSENQSYLFWEEIDQTKKEIYLSCRTFDNADSYTDNLRFAGPFSYAGDVPDIFSVASSAKGRIVVTVLSKIDEIGVYTSTDGGRTFSEGAIHTKDNVLIAPRVYNRSGGGFRLFTSLSEGTSFHLYCSESSDGKLWTDFDSFLPSDELKNPFVPVEINLPDCEMVVFQAQYTSEVTGRLSYQLYSTYTQDKGLTWSEPVLITDKNSLYSNDRKNFASYTNQRPYLFVFQNEIYIAWERTENINSSIWIAKLNKKGIVPKSMEKISDSGNASRAIIFEYDDNLYTEWFDTRTGVEAVYMARKNGEDWKQYTLVENSSSNFFSYPLILKNPSNGKEELSFIWQKIAGNKNSICILSPDKTVQPVKLSAVSYKEGKRSKDKNVQIRIKFPEDSSQIAGYSYTWGNDNQEEPEHIIQNTVKTSQLNLQADGDGKYNLLVSVQDKAGNWSKAAEISYYRDLTPPSAPSINPLALDKFGLPAANIIKMSWNAPPEEDVAGYNYTFERLGSIPKNLVENKTHKINLPVNQVSDEISVLEEKYKADVQKNTPLKSSILTAGNSSKNYSNYENGVYLFSVSAIDEVGNTSLSSRILVILNKFRPSTYITSVSQAENELGQLEMEIHGGGFNYEGAISEIYIDSDGKAPYDLVLKRENGDFTVRSNKLISKVKIGTELEEGSYRIGLLHTDRGLYFTQKPILKITQTGTLKIESDYQIPRHYTLIENVYRYSVPISVILAGIILVLIFAIIQSVVVYTVQERSEAAIIQKEINALLTGEAMPLSKEKSKKKARRQQSLRGKLVGFTVVLVTAVVIFVSIQNGRTMIKTQQTDLADGLYNRVDVLLDSLVSGVENYLPTENTEIKFLVDQKNAVPEVEYVTILGPKISTNDSPDKGILNYVWASDDPDISNKVTKFDQYGIESGVSEITSEEELGLIAKYSAINTESKKLVQDLSEQIAENQNEHRNLQSYTDSESEKRRNVISQNIMSLRNEIKDKLHQLAKENAGTSPYFNINDISSSQSDEYLFYRPVLYREGTSDSYLHGLIIVKVTTKELINTIKHSIITIIITAAIVAVIAVLAGAIGAWFLSGIMIKPIRKLETQLVEIGSIMTKSARERMRLSRRKIDITSNDEIGRLGEAVNSMTYKLGMAAEDEYLNDDGKKVQECFIPLQTGEGGVKLPIVKLNEPKLDLFAFYKGDSTVSGDYFDYRKLDDKWYVFVKCDVSGHGEPAALLVSVVATKFKDIFYFGKWNPASGTALLKKFVTSVNDFIFELGTRGKFSTINVSLYNKDTGEIYFCNAGDNKIHILEKATGKLKEYTLANLPTAGGISTDLVEMTAGGYKIEKFILNPGDILYLYTDGIDEAERLVRDSDFTVKQTTKTDKVFNRKTGKEETITLTLDKKEQFGQERITSILEAYNRKQVFTLEKEDNPRHETLKFDFSECSGTIDESVTALASIERVFRMVKSPEVQNSDEIEVEKMIDDFLKKCFNLYPTYCKPVRNTVEIQEKKTKKHILKNNQESEKEKKLIEDPNVTRYSGILEDKQADDITIIAIKRN